MKASAVSIPLSQAPANSEWASLELKDSNESLHDPLSSLPPSARATLQRSQKQQSGLRRRTPNERSLQRSYTAVGDTQGDEADGEDEPPRKPMREILQGLLESKYSQFVMTSITLFALFGDDMRIAFFFLSADVVFFAIYTISLFLFALELTLQSMVIDGYKYSFFFVLDCIATASLLPDIPWFTEPLYELFFPSGDGESGTSELAAAGKASRAGTRAGRIVRLVRLVRLIRVVRISSFLAREKKSELDQQGEDALKKKQDKEKRVQASRLGKILSESTTRRVIVGVLSMMIIWPNLEITIENLAPVYGLENLYYFGRSTCGDIDRYLDTDAMIGLRCNATLGRESPWLTAAGWEFLVYHYSLQSRAMQKELYVPQRLLSLRVPNFANGGIVEDIKFVKTTRCVELSESVEDLSFRVPADGLTPTPCFDKYCCWAEHPTCGMSDRSLCPWRASEMKVFAFQPPECLGEDSPCKGLTLIARFLVRSFTEAEAKASIGLTTFVVFLLGFGSISFSNDTQRLVIAPIEKMVNIVKQLADDPLRKPEIQDEAGDEVVEVEKNKEKKNTGQLDTGMLESTILKIGSLLQVGFGEAGAIIIGQNMAAADGELNIMKAGRKVVAIYGFCRICDFLETTQCLNEEVMVFVNKIGHILHTCVHHWRGSANKNMGDSFMVTWIVTEKVDQEAMLLTGVLASDKMQELTDRAFIAFVKVTSEVRRAADLAAYAKHPKMIPKFGMSYKVRLAFSLHSGWGVEGAIGSRHKIDASYVSPHVNIAQRVLDATEIYGSQFLLTDTIWNCLCQSARDRTRKIDTVMIKGATEPTGLYHVDFSSAIIPTPEGHELGDILPTAEITVTELRTKAIETLFTMDQDMVGLLEGISLDFITSWRGGYNLYMVGTWDHALTNFQRCSNLMPDGDGPSETLIAFILEHNAEPPEGWSGVRELQNRVKASSYDNF